MASGAKVGLAWDGKDERQPVEACELIEDPSRSFRAEGPGGVFDNMLVHGDCVPALKALEERFAGRVKCVYIDPPYNTGSDFRCYDDWTEHSTWLGTMREVLESIRTLLSDDGCVYVQIDDNEMPYLRVLMDEVFLRRNFVATLVWRKKSGGGMDSDFFVTEHEYVLVYGNKGWSIVDEKVPPDESDFNHVVNGRKAQLVKLEKWGSASYREDRPSLHYAVKDPDGNDYFPVAPDGRDGRWRKKPETLDPDHVHWLKRGGKYKPYEVLYFDEAKHRTVKTRTIWTDVGNNAEAAEELKALFGAKSFDTPKPERLIAKILSLSTKPGDLVLDAFLGSGTTAAVAHKMGRRWIGIELGDQCYEHCKVRLDKVIGGTDEGGVTEAADWHGGGGYSFYEAVKR